MKMWIPLNEYILIKYATAVTTVDVIIMDHRCRNRIDDRLEGGQDGRMC